jgi:hypothetical protein
LTDVASGAESPEPQIGTASSSAAATVPQAAVDTAAPDTTASPPRQSSLPGFDQP